MKESTVPEKQETNVPGTREETRTLTPPVDIFEVKEDLAVVVDVPGVDKDNVEVHIENDVLTISARPTAKPPGTSLYREFELANYFRQFQLSEHVDQEKIRAEVKAGVLTIILPKAEKAKPKKISVAVAS
jgi:HSP20 family molecular chaperone IbpA